jgi:hypothetical protein
MPSDPGAFLSFLAFTVLRTSSSVISRSKLSSALLVFGISSGGSLFQ